jgi:F-box-like
MAQADASLARLRESVAHLQGIVAEWEACGSPTVGEDVLDALTDVSSRVVRRRRHRHGNDDNNLEGRPKRRMGFLSRESAEFADGSLDGASAAGGAGGGGSGTFPGMSELSVTLNAAASSGADKRHKFPGVTARAATPLPREMWVAIFRRLSVRSRRQAALACRRFHQYARDATHEVVMHDADASVFTSGFVALNYRNVEGVRVNSVRVPLRGLLAPLARRLKRLIVTHDDLSLDETSRIDVSAMYELSRLEEVQWSSAVPVDWRQFSSLRRMSLQITGSAVVPLPRSLHALELQGPVLNDRILLSLVGQVRRLRHLAVTSASITIAGLSQLPGRLRTLSIQSCPNVLGQLELLPMTLEKLSLWRVGITGFSQCAGGKLSELRIHGCPVSADAFARALRAESPNCSLRVCDFSECMDLMQDDFALASPSAALANCEALASVAAPASVVRAVLDTYPTAFSRLSKLKISGSIDLSMLAVHTSGLSALTIDGEGLGPLVGVFPPNLRSLRLSGIPQLASPAYFPLSLTRLELSSCSLLDSHCIAIRPLANLHFLVMLDCRSITDAGLAHLSSLAGLWELTLEGLPLITAEGVAGSIPQLGRVLEKLAVKFCEKVDLATLQGLLGEDLGVLLEHSPAVQGRLSDIQLPRLSGDVSSTRLSGELAAAQIDDVSMS